MPAPAASDPGSLSIPRLVIGLGNPGNSYRDTRHNVGFLVLDELAQRMNFTFQLEKRWNAQLARSGNTWFIKPQTFMNASGDAAAAVARFHRIPTEHTLAIYDDGDLALGTLRMKLDGSAAGHNGVKSLIAQLGSPSYPRLKLGVAGPTGRPTGDDMSDFVLSPFRLEERPLLTEMIQRAADAVMLALQKGVDAAMNHFNRKSTDTK